MLAVTSRTFTSNAPRIAFKISKATLSPPPAIVLTMSSAANRPLNVRTSFSPVPFTNSPFSPVSLSLAVNLWNESIRKYNLTANSPMLGTSNISPQAVLAIFTKSSIVNPIFLRESMRSVLPSF